MNEKMQTIPIRWWFTYLDVSLQFVSSSKIESNYSETRQMLAISPYNRLTSKCSFHSLVISLKIEKTSKAIRSGRKPLGSIYRYGYVKVENWILNEI